MERRYGGGGGGGSRHYHHHGTPYDRPTFSSSNSYGGRESIEGASGNNKRFFSDKNNVTTSSSGYSSRPRTIEEVLSTETLLNLDQFLRIDDYASRQSDIERQRLYGEYLIKHRRAAAERLFLQHKTEAWFQENVAISSFNNQQDNLKESDQQQQAYKRYAAFKSKIMNNQEFLDILSLEDGNDIQLMDNSDSSSIRNLSSSMRLPERFCCEFMSNPSDSNINTASNSNNSNNNNLTVLISNIPPGLQKSILSQTLSMISGGLLTKLELDDPVPEKGFYRIGWATFEDGTDMMACISKLEQNLINGEKLYYSYQKSFTRQLNVFPSLADESILKKHVGICQELLETLNKKANIPNEETEELLELIKNKSIFKQLDFLILILRKVHFCCFYCNLQSPNESSLRKNCGHLHIRGKISPSSPSASASSILPSSFNPEGFLEMIKTRFEPAIVDFLIEKTVERVDEGRYRCSHCSKLFKGPEFVVKHIKLKHEDILKEFEDDIKLLNNYLDHPFMLLAPPSLSSFTSSSSSFSSGGANFSFENGNVGGVGRGDGSHQYPPPSSSNYHHSNANVMGMRRNSRDRYHTGRDGMGGGNRGAPPIHSSSESQSHPSNVPFGRQLQRYVDLDAPPTGDIEINYE